MLTLFVIILASYVLGSVPSAFIVGRVRGVYLEQHGSGNAGATNALRVLGTRYGALVFAMDILKGFLATRALSLIRLGEGIPAWLGSDPNADMWVMVIAGAAAMTGHVFTIIGRYFYGSWRGGKGVATGAGMLLGLIPVAILIAIAIFAAVVALTRYVSLGSILATSSIPFTLLIERALGFGVPGPFFAFAVIVPLFIIYTHRSNVKRLLNGTESRIGQSKAEPST